MSRANDEAQLRATSLCREAAASGGLVVVLTGAGISADSGIPTFRGKEGYWRVGSVNYHPQELATSSAFARVPHDVWRWYLHRHEICAAAAPNVAHESLVEVERALGDRFLLITQNVDGLHTRAGTSPRRCHEIHGNIHHMRCADGCRPDVLALPVDVTSSDQNAAVRAALSCEGCGGWMRPHILWFDEMYDERYYRFDSSLRAAGEAALLLIVGTTGATNLPNHVTRIASARGAALVVINPEPTPFTELASRYDKGAHLAGTASRWLPLMINALATEEPRA